MGQNEGDVPNVLAKLNLVGANRVRTEMKAIKGTAVAPALQLQQLHDTLQISRYVKKQGMREATAGCSRHTTAICAQT